MGLLSKKSVTLCNVLGITGLDPSVSYYRIVPQEWSIILPPKKQSKPSEQSFWAIILPGSFFNGASNHFTAIILAGEKFQRQHEKTIISVKIVVPPRNINVSFLWSSVLRYSFSFSQPSTQKVFVLPTRFLFALTRPRLSVENPRSERAVCREGRSNLKAGGPPFISAVFERVAGGGEGAWFPSRHRCWESPLCPVLARIPKYGSVSYLGTQDSPEPW